MAAMAMVQAQNAKNMGGKFPKKVKLSTFFFFKTLYLCGKTRPPDANSRFGNSQKA
jgi:hypothetical protein